MSFFRGLFGVGPDTRKPEEIWQAVFPYELLKVTGADAPEMLKILRLEGKEEGFTPVLVGDGNAVELLVEAADDGEPEDYLQEADEVDIHAFFAEPISDDPEYDENAVWGEWPDEPEPLNSISAHLDSEGRPRPVVYIAKIPTPVSWEVPAYLKFGGWNACPFPEEHVAIARYWRERYGAEIVSVTGDTIEYLVAYPPSTRKGAELLADEQFHYCEDIVFQGVETVCNLAATVLNARVWYFWWD